MVEVINSTTVTSVAEVNGARYCWTDRQNLWSQSLCVTDCWKCFYTTCWKRQWRNCRIIHGCAQTTKILQPYCLLLTLAYCLLSYR